MCILPPKNDLFFGNLNCLFARLINMSNLKLRSALSLSNFLNTGIYPMGYITWDKLHYPWNFFKILQTALMKASIKGRTDIVKILLEHKGIDINAKDI